MGSGGRGEAAAGGRGIGHGKREGERQVSGKTERLGMGKGRGWRDTSLRTRVVGIPLRFSRLAGPFGSGTGTRTEEI